MEGFRPGHSEVVMEESGSEESFLLDYKRMERIADFRLTQGRLESVSFGSGADNLVSQTGLPEGVVQIWTLFDSPQALIDTARAHVTRQLTDAQREEFNLAPRE